MTRPIEDWWPPLDVGLRRWITNNIWTPLDDYARSEPIRFGGPDDTGDFWQVRDEQAPALAVSVGDLGQAPSPDRLADQLN